MRARHGRGWLHYFMGLLLNAIAFAGLGPLVAYPVAAFFMSFGLVGYAWFNSQFGLTSLMDIFAGIFFMAPFGVFVSYSIGIVPAALTGLVVGFASSWIADEKRLLFMAAVVGALLSPSTYTEFSSFSSGDGSPMSLPLGGVLTFAATGGTVALLMTKWTRGLRLRPSQLPMLAGHSEL